jgi:hypothetical protein
MCVEVLAWVAAARGDAERSATLFGAALGNWRAFGLPRFESSFFETHHHRFTRLAADRTGADRYLAAYTQGLVMDLSDVIECVRETPGGQSGGLIASSSSSASLR